MDVDPIIMKKPVAKVKTSTDASARWKREHSKAFHNAEKTYMAMISEQGKKFNKPDMIAYRKKKVAAAKAAFKP